MRNDRYPSAEVQLGLSAAPYRLFKLILCFSLRRNLIPRGAAYYTANARSKSRKLWRTNVLHYLEGDMFVS